MTDKIVVLNTCNSEAEARRVARALIDKRLAACVQVTPAVTSIYRWKDAIEESTEFILIIKTARRLVEPLRLELERLHSYEVPEFVALPIVDGSPNYLNWLEAELAGPADE